MRRKLQKSGAWESPRAISNSLTRYPRIALKVNLRGVALIAWSNNVEPLGVTYFDSTTTVRPWKTTQPRLSSTFISEPEHAPVITLDENGHGTVIYRTTTSASGIYQVTSIRYQNGTGWAPSPEVLPNSSGIWTYADFKSIRAVSDKDGNILVCFLIKNLVCSYREVAAGIWSATPEVAVLSTNPASIVISRPFALAPGTDHQFLLTYMKSTDRTLYATFIDTHSGTPAVLEPTTTALTPTALTTDYDQFQLEAELDAQGNGLIAWGAREYRILSYTTGTSAPDLMAVRLEKGVFSAPRAIDTGSGTAILRSLSVSPTGEALVSWLQTGESGQTFLKAALFGHNE